MEHLYLVNTIYPAFMGEVNKFGIGVQCTFIRLAGCNLRCFLKTKGCLCDTPEALDVKSGTEMTVEQILSKVTNYGNGVVCLTGGEPLLQDVEHLLIVLTNNGYHVVIETNGSMSISKYRHIRNVSFVVDYKLEGTGETSKMYLGNHDLMDEDDVLKFVISSVEDYLSTKQWVHNYRYSFKGKIAFGLMWGTAISYEWLLNRLMLDNLSEVSINFQTHKMMCMYDHYRYSDDFRKILIPKDL